MDIYHEIPPRFQVEIDRELCRLCERCTVNCTYDVHSFTGERIASKSENCVACQRCATMCPQGAISIRTGKVAFPPHGTYTDRIRRIIYEQASTGGVMLAGSGTDLPYRVIFDDLLLDAAQVTNPSIDPLREPVETVTYLGRKPDRMVVAEDDGRLTVARGADYPNVRLSTPLVVGHMSLGSISYNACTAIFRAAQEVGIMVGTGEGGLHPDFYAYADVINSEVASGRFGIEPRYLKEVAALEIKIGQGAKPGHGGHLPGEKVDALISETRMIPRGPTPSRPTPTTTSTASRTWRSSSAR